MTADPRDAQALEQARQALIDAACVWGEVGRRIKAGKATGAEAFGAADVLQRAVDAYVSATFKATR